MDLRAVYAGARRQFLSHAEADKRRALTEVLPRLVFECRWRGSVRMKSASALGVGEWEDVFLLLQGRRLVWFGKEEDIVDGREALGQLVFQGHAGTTQASPVEVREMGEESRLLAVFGADTMG